MKHGGVTPRKAFPGSKPAATPGSVYNRFRVSAGTTEDAPSLSADCKPYSFPTRPSSQRQPGPGGRDGDDRGFPASRELDEDCARQRGPRWLWFRAPERSNHETSTSICITKAQFTPRKSPLSTWSLHEDTQVERERVAPAPAHTPGMEGVYLADPAAASPRSSRVRRTSTGAQPVAPGDGMSAASTARSAPRASTCGRRSVHGTPGCSRRPQGRGAHRRLRFSDTFASSAPGHRGRRRRAEHPPRRRRHVSEEEARQGAGTGGPAARTTRPAAERPIR